MTTAEPSDPDVATPFDANDPKQVNERNSRAGHRTRRLRGVLQSLLSTQDGREWLWSFMDDFMTTRKTVVEGAAPYAQGFRDGEREVGLRVLRMCREASPENFTAMLVENDG